MKDDNISDLRMQKQKNNPKKRTHTNRETGTNSNSHSNSQKTHNTHSQSGTTKTEASTPEGIPFEIGGHTFDTSDEVSIISFSTTLRGASPSFETTAEMSDKVKKMNEKWVKGRGEDPTKTKLLGDYDNDDHDDCDESISNFTRISI
eukprot:CAMPEP_0203660634 /NCGR_PEP_ID=MMETSP0088-20131115/57263_1 /ASSEMBLY_ACC=CAM_ASM_001087 /TAXON_ID=426623 /ORGANISM="Chaetoceros affinis, Strain CCMP159" /LENGTH=146 /DNA_ID=CAMNT_0050523085 /DNA_START=188 /DNA_END=628 /DNA_ORIENTATION=+